MDKNVNNDNIKNTADSNESVEATTPLEAVTPDPTSNIWTTYVPRFTEASDNFRAMGDAKLREKLSEGELDVELPTVNPDEIKLDPTAEFEADVNGTDAKVPENKALDEHDESINIYKFAGESEEPADDTDVLAQTESDMLDEIRSLLNNYDKKDEPIPEEPIEEPVVEEVVEKPVIPDPDEDFKVYEKHDKHEDDVDLPSGLISDSQEYRFENGEFTNPAERDVVKDKFLDSIFSINIRLVASIVFAVALLAVEILSAFKIISFSVFPGAEASILAWLDFILASGIFIMALPDTIRSVKYLTKKTILPDTLPIVAYLALLLYTLAVALSGADKYALFGFLFATAVIPVIRASLYRTKADFIAFKMISQNEEKQIIDRKNTRDNKEASVALDYLVDSYKSQIARVHKTKFVADFFKSSADTSSVPMNVAIIYGIPLAIALIAGLVVFFIESSIVAGASVFALVSLLGCPAFAVLSSKVPFFHSQRAAIQIDSTAIGEGAHHEFSGVDVFIFDDTDIFGPDDVNLRRFILYDERDSMENAMRQMCALFAAVGGPLDYMFSNAIDNRVRHKTATNVIVEDDGLCGDVMGHRIYAGSEDYMRRNKIAIPNTGSSSDTGGDTTKVMYAAEDGEVYAKFFIRYSFSEEFTMILPELRESGIIPLVYTRDPNVSVELLNAISAGANNNMKIVRLYTPAPMNEEVHGRVRAKMVTYGDRIDAASMIVLSKKYRKFSAMMQFIELCSMAIGVLLAIVLSVIGVNISSVLIASVWQIVWCQFISIFSKQTFLKNENKE